MDNLENKELCLARQTYFDEKLKYFTEDPSRRALEYVPTPTSSSMRCEYKTQDGKKCWVGLDIPEYKYVESMEGESVTDLRIFGSLPHSIQDLGITFLQRCQRLHDDDKNWDNKGLTEQGKRNVQVIINKFITPSIKGGRRMKNANKTLTEFTGTENYYKFIAGLRLTDGVRYAAEEFGIFWFLDIISSYQSSNTIIGEVFQTWELKRLNDDEFVVTATDGNENILITQQILFSDFKDDIITMWCVENVIMLPSEY